MTVILVFIILACFAFVGYGLAKYYITRKKFFSELCLLIKSLELDISFSQDKLIKVINSNKENCNSSDVKILCDNYIDYLQRQKSKENLFDNIKILKEDEKQVINSFFNGLGRLDSINQSKEISSYLVKFTEFYESSRGECGKYASLFIKLSIILGLFVCLLIL